MKYKSIEAMPYLTIPSCSRKKGVKYICRTEIMDIKGEEHFILEIYRNKKNSTKIPVARVVMAQKGYGTYFPEQELWSGKQFTGNSWDDEGILGKIEPMYRSRGGVEKNFVLLTQEDRDRIEKYCQGVYVWRKENWWEFISEKQRKIKDQENRGRWRRRSERRQRALDERAKATPELPEQRILQYAEDSLFHHKHYLYYKKHGSRAKIACSACGNVADKRWKAGISYESQFESVMEEPRHGYSGRCPICGAGVKFFAAGRAKTVETQKKYIFIGQRYKETGMIIRYIDVQKEWQLEMLVDDTGMVMQGAYERMDGIEIARAYFEPGKKLQIDYHKHSYYSGKDFWDDCNLSGNANITIREAAVMPETWDAMKESFLKYSALEEFRKAAGDVQVIDYLEHYVQTPQIEMLVKMHMIQIVKRLVRYNYGIVVDADSNRMDRFLGIRKERIKMLMNELGDTTLLDILQKEKRWGKPWTEEQIRKLTELESGERRLDIRIPLKYMTMQKFLNRIKKYAGCEFGSGCNKAVHQLYQTARTYVDYLNMREELGYDLHNSVYQYPRDLEASHNKMVLEKNREEMSKRQQEVEEKYPMIRKRYKKLRKRYYYEDSEYIIRPARSAGEIVREGQILHHCVGGNDYLKNHDKGIGYILLLRFREKPEEPYITIEIDAESNQILQWHGKYNKKPDEDNMKRWINRYEQWLKGDRVEEKIRILATA